MYVEVLCSACGKRHSAGGFLPLPGAPTEEGSLAELYPDGGMPGWLASVLNDLLWCENVKEYVGIEDPARVFVGPGVALEDVWKDVE